MESRTLLGEGTNGRILAHTSDTVEKVCKRKATGHDLTTQIRIHGLIEKLVGEMSESQTFFVPALVRGLNSSAYCMRRIDTSEPVFLMDCPQLLPEFITLWKKMWYYGFALYDFELYRQPDGRIAILDFDKTCFRQTNPECSQLFLTPFQIGNHPVVDIYFKHSCFPVNFLEAVVGHEGGLDEQLKRLAALPYHGRTES